MFLDDELFAICENHKLCKNGYDSTGNDVQLLYGQIMSKTESYLKSKVTPVMTDKQLKTEFERTFNLFDSFVTQLNKSDNKTLNILGKVFLEYTFKKVYLDNPDILRVYNSIH